MTRTARVFSALAAVLLALAAAVVLGATADAASGDAARLVEQMRAAAGAHDFTATVEVTWHNAAGARKQATVDLRAVNGALEVSAGDQVVLDQGGHTFVKDELGWWTPPSEPRPSRHPSPDARWGLALRHGTALGRATSTVVASRADGSVAQRLTIDDATDVLVGREVVDRDGSVERGFRFTSFVVTPRSNGAASIGASPTATAKDASPVRAVPTGFDAPGTIGAGWVLVTKSRHGDGVQLAYSDGLFTLSVLEQQGELDWNALPGGGSGTTVDGARARRYAQPLGDVVVWEQDGVVFTCVSDAPRDVYVTALAGITGGPSTVDRVVDFVLGPFGFD
ncbi:MAG: hypothetical protein ACHQIG_07900 [Acidimicrobiia bacterium]